MEIIDILTFIFFLKKSWKHDDKLITWFKFADVKRQSWKARWDWQLSCKCSPTTAAPDSAPFNLKLQVYKD
jgi:hypothetical protein